MANYPAVYADRLANLPDPASSLVFLTLQPAEDAHDAADLGFETAIAKAKDDVSAEQGRLASAKRDYDFSSSREFGKDFAEAVEAAQKRYDRANVRYQRLVEQRNMHRANAPYPISDRIKTLRAGTYGMRDLKFDRRKNEPLADTLKRTQEGRAALLDQYAEIDLAPLPIADGIASIKADIRMIAKEPDARNTVHMNNVSTIGRTLMRQGGVKWPKVYFGAGDSKIDVAGLLFWLFGDEIAKKLSEQLASEHEFDQPMSRHERELQKNEIKASLERLEFEEGAIVRAMIQDGESVTFRRDMHIEAALGIELIEAAPRPGFDKDGELQKPKNRIEGNVGYGFGHLVRQ